MHHRIVLAEALRIIVHRWCVTVFDPGHHLRRSGSELTVR
jgi:hypothetical protein